MLERVVLRKSPVGCYRPLGGLCPVPQTFAQCLLLYFLSTLNKIPCIEWERGDSHGGGDGVGDEGRSVIRGAPPLLRVVN